MINYNDPLNSVVDPRGYSFEVSNECIYAKKIFDKLAEIEAMFPNKKYASIFYERYAKDYDNDVICKHHNINERELNLRLLEIVKFINQRG